jgi:sporulation protein YlmC with PRC-barrel domain
VNLTRDILDQQVVDRTGQRLGKVDGVILELRDGEPPRVAAIEIGPVTLTRRIHPRLAEWLGGWLRRHGPRTDGTLRIPWSKVRAIGVDLRVDLVADGTPARAWEDWLREHVIRRIPGSRQ